MSNTLGWWVGKRVSAMKVSATNNVHFLTKINAKKLHISIKRYKFAPSKLNN